MRLSFFLLFVLGLAAQTPADFEASLSRVAHRQLAERSAAIARIHSRADAEARQREVRAKIMAAIGGLPDYKGPLNARVLGTLEAPTHFIDKVVFESLPRYFVTGNLYRPKSAGKHPGILFPVGHWDEGKAAPQRMAANLAAKGFVVFVFDPIGQAERMQAYDGRLQGPLMCCGVPQHWLAGTQAILLGETFARYHVWDAKRALDYLVSRPEVDSRIGCTGCSGGGTITTYISALDDRIKVAAPLCYMNSFSVLFDGSIGDSEQSLPSFLSSGLDQSDYVELFAPKPWFIGSTEKDFFTPAGAKVVFDEAQSFYRHFDYPERVKWVVGPGGHGTPLAIREGVYDWMLRWLQDGKGNAAEEPVRMFPNKDLLVGNVGQIAVDFKSRDLVKILRERLDVLPRRQDIAAFLRERIPKSEPDVARGTAAVRDGLRVEALSWPAGDGLRITAQLLRPDDAKVYPGVVSVERSDVLSERAFEIAKAGAIVIAVLPRGLPAPAKQAEYGDWAAATRSWLTGHSLPLLRAGDIATAAGFVAQVSSNPSRISAVADGTAGAWLLMATAAEPRLQRLWLEQSQISLASLLDSPIHRFAHDVVVPDILRHGDFSDLAQGRDVRWVDPTGWNGERLRPDGAQYHYRYFEEGGSLMIPWLLR